ncbi:MAG: hypothetical protein HRT57_09510 [Crocinitomicaceae bacterium]|nr:hypothetical protein [Crocinitomicaceae bacterium]
MNNQFSIRTFRAINEPETCQKYVESHMDVLRLYGITEITSAKEEWFKNPASYVIIAEDYFGNMVGGIRVHEVGGTQPLPVEDAIGFMDPGIHSLVKNHHVTRGAGELCGLWNSRTVAGMGLSKVLVRAGLSITNQIGINTMFGICAEITLPMFRNVGYGVEHSLGKEGTFYYPKQDLLAYALIMDANTMSHASPDERYRVLELREEPSIVGIESGPKGIIELQYELNQSTMQAINC